MTIVADDFQWMARAIQLAKGGIYTTRPNPNVGCVLVKENALLAEGFHYRAGEAHAEVHALRQANEHAQGATAYVTLEPCSHQGKTGPCCEALIAAKVARVVYGMTDPNPLVAGRGLARLREAGITVDGPILEAECQSLNPGFSKRMQTGLPWVRCKIATSLDGRTAMASGESKWITGAAARADVQRLRARSGAIVTGIGSILADNSRLTLRKSQLDLPNGEDIVQCAPLRVVLDSQLRIADDAAVLSTDATDALTLIITSVTAHEQYGQRIADWQSALPHVAVRTVKVDDAGRIVLPAMLKLLAQEFQINDVLVEAGATLNGALLMQDLVDELIVYQAPVILGSNAKPMMDLPLSTMAEKLQLTITDTRPVGNDWRISATLVKRNSGIKTTNLTSKN